MACHTIRECAFPGDSSGVPRKLASHRGEQLATDGPEFRLLGPSDGLVRKHWDRLPIGHYMALATFDRVPVMSISPSNQLSYVIRIALLTRQYSSRVTQDA